eukprot:scaffold598_cov318-Pavlova_lutheri.AAC.38
MDGRSLGRCDPFPPGSLPSVPHDPSGSVPDGRGGLAAGGGRGREETPRGGGGRRDTEGGQTERERQRGRGREREAAATRGDTMPTYVCARRRSEGKGRDGGVWEAGRKDADGCGTHAGTISRRSPWSRRARSSWTSCCPGPKGKRQPSYTKGTPSPESGSST